MKTYQYRSLAVLKESSNTQDQLNEYGKNGFKLISVLDSGHGEVQYIFRRRIKKATGSDIDKYYKQPPFEPEQEKCHLMRCKHCGKGTDHLFSGFCSDCVLF